MRQRGAWLAGAMLVALLIAFVVLPPWPIVLLDADTLAYAVCHRIPSHSFSIAGRQLPLCARCTGIFLGGLATLLFLAVARPKARAMPAVPILGLFLLFIASMAIDGFNSFLTLVPGASPVYAPRNWLRLATGGLHGIAMAGILLPVFNQTVWADGRDQAVMTRRELLLLLPVAAGIGAVILTEAPMLLWPLFVLSGVGVLALMGLINLVLVVVATRRERSFRSWPELVPGVLYALLLTFFELGAINVLRHWVEAAMGVSI